MTKDSPKTQKYSKAAFLNAANTTNEKLLFDTLLKEDSTYSREEVTKLVATWKSKEVKR